MTEGPLFTFRMIPLISAELSRRGIDGADLVRAAELPLDALHGDVTAPLARIVRFIDLAAQRLGDDRFGLTLAQLNPAGAYGVAEFLVRSAPRLDSALRVLCEAAALVNPVLRFDFESDASEARLRLAVVGQRDTLGRHLNEYTLAYIARQFRAILDGGFPVNRVWFTHARDCDQQAVAAAFGCDDAQFGQRDCGFAVAQVPLATAARTSDPMLFGFLLGQAKAELGRLVPSDCVAQVMRVIESRLGRADVTADSVAAAIGMSVRSLQRQLEAAGTSYRDVLAHVRERRHQELASGGLADGTIAKQLGFSTAKSMRRSLGCAAPHRLAVARRQDAAAAATTTTATGSTCSRRRQARPQ